MNATGVVFDGNDLQTDWIIVSNVIHENIPEKDMPAYNVAHSNKHARPFVNYPSKSITIEGVVTGDSVADFDQNWDTFKSYFINKEANLDIDYAGDTRRYTATLRSLKPDRPGGLLVCNFSATFACQPFGEDVDTTTALSASGRTEASYDDNHTFTGTAKHQLIVATITINSVSGGDGHITLKNNANDQGVTVIGQTFEGGDELTIDSVERKVSLNGDEIDHLGAFPEFERGAQSIGYRDGFDSRNFDIEIVYNAMYV